MSSPAHETLTVVMPVYNEEQAIASVLEEWLAMLDALGVPYELRVYDDGSRDGTAGIVRQVAARAPRLRLIQQENRGHGPTVLRGYREATGDWVFQTDSDGELPAASFPGLWALRGAHEVVIGRRVGRSSPAHRRLLTAGARATIAALFGPGITDTNIPFRLMRRSWLHPLLVHFHDDIGVPNIVLSGLCRSTGARVAEVDVPFQARRGGQTSLDARKIARLARAAVADSLSVARRSRRT